MILTHSYLFFVCEVLMMFVCVLVAMLKMDEGDMMVMTTE